MTDATKRAEEAKAAQTAKSEVEPAKAEPATQQKAKPAPACKSKMTREYLEAHGLDPRPYGFK